MNTYHLAPASDPQDIYAAGYDGNKFESVEDALSAIPGLRAVDEDYDHEWVVVTCAGTRCEIVATAGGWRRGRGRPTNA